MSGRHRRGFSPGSVLMILLTILVLISSLLMLFRLAGGRSVDFSRLHLSFAADEAQPAETVSGTFSPEK